jgi:regulator of replication initiation timing
MGLRDANMHKDEIIRTLESRINSMTAEKTAVIQTTTMRSAEDKKRMEAENEKLKRQIEQMLADAQKKKDKKLKCCALF